MTSSDEYLISNDTFQNVVEEMECGLYDAARFCQNSTVETVEVTDLRHQNRSIEEIDASLSRKEHKKWNDILKSKDPFEGD